MYELKNFNEKKYVINFINDKSEQIYYNALISHTK
jgi:hypothetical protein